MEPTNRRRPRKTAAQWAEVLSAYRDSEQTQEAFAQSYGVGVAALRNWLYRRTGPATGEERTRARGAGRAGGFVPVRLLGADAGPRQPPTLTIRWPQGPSVELHIAPSSPGVAELILSLIGPCSR